MKQILPIYLLIVSVLAVWVTLSDKAAAKHHDERVPEAWLLLIGLLGGAAAEWICMKLAHHKTRRRLFMVGLPLFTVLHVILAVFILQKEFV